MVISISLPDDIAQQIEAKWQDLPRRTLQAVVADAYRDGLVTGFEVQTLLGLPDRFALDAFLKSAGTPLLYDEEDLEADRRTLRELGLR
ncbi:MAG TPA: UPF0175 family protein [Thermoanaerobaculia bacterium]|nr:UPF0175 family protein [Thermoanaerobaculia bacterium]